MSRYNPLVIFHPFYVIVSPPVSVTVSSFHLLFASPTLSVYSSSGTFYSRRCLSISLSLSLSLSLSFIRTYTLSVFLSVVCHPWFSSLFNDNVTNASTAASIMRATLSRRDQQRLNCIRDSRTAHKFSSPRCDGPSSLTRFSSRAVIRRLLIPPALSYFSSREIYDPVF